MSSQSGLGRRAAVGAMLVAGRSLIAQAVALVAVAVLTRHLSAREFGLLAAGTAITAFASTFADVGLAAGLIRSRVRPSRMDLRTALGLQLVSMCVLAGAAAAVVAPFGRIAAITDLMLVSIPLTVWQTPARVVLERELAYRRVAVVEMAQSFVFSGWCVAAVLAGFGVWGVATATIAQAITGSAAFLALVPEARITPSFSLTRARSLMRFGLQFQAVNITNLVRDHGLALAVGAILGLPALGFWNVASRVLRAPLTLYGAVWRVSYPAMSRVVEHDRAPRRVLERAMTAAAVGCGLILAPLGGSALAAVPVIFGSQWRDVAYTLAPACVALLLGGPVSLATAGYLYALGDVRSILRSSILHTVAWFAFTLPLLPLIGVPAVGVGWIAGALVDASVLSRAARAHAGISRVRPVIFPTVMAVAAGSASFAVAATLRPTPAGAGASIGVALATYVAGLAIAARLRPRSATVEPLAAFARSGRDILRRRTRRPANVTADALGRP